ncbi:hypothetical protein CJD36_022495 [Flavipsychrobacter stenotrophus]|uniref:PEGA domain-containing protein n=1 Tax=Flavipsychrobacter stenotrophus TaxID=2077091 RepID=A0A2S7SPF5_9BACT|nr:hypothetical protein [Flavipsychrobacter stenotrophus]PQJ08772.1 hypothetical protein CJD36_022495 [Flavipsychrobacter stenotrophus]
MKITITILLLSALFLSSCAKRVTVSYGGGNDNVGTVKIKPSTTIKGASVTMDGKLVWDKRKRIKTLTVTNVPKGNHEVNVVSESWAYKESLNDKQTVKITGSGDNKAVLVSVPPYSTGYYIYMTVIIIVCLLPSLIAL